MDILIVIQYEVLGSLASIFSYQFIVYV